MHITRRRLAVTVAFVVPALIGLTGCTRSARRSPARPTRSCWPAPPLPKLLGVKPGRVLFELSGVTEDVAREAMRLAIHKLPMKARFIKREAGDY